MAFGIHKQELAEWKRQIDNGNIAFLTHYWLDERFPHCRTVTKSRVQGFRNARPLGKKVRLKKEWIDKRKDGYSHFDLLGDRQKEILEREGLQSHIEKFQL